MQRIVTRSVPAFHADSGIDAISRRSAAQPIFFPGEDLHPSLASDQPQLAQLFPLRSFEDFIWERLTPTFYGNNFLMPGRFRTILSTLCGNVRALAKDARGSSRRYGKLALVLDDQDEMALLAHTYFGALFQG